MATNQELQLELERAARQAGVAIQTMNDSLRSFSRDFYNIPYTYIIAPPKPQRDPSYAYFDDVPAKRFFSKNRYRMTTWPELARLELFFGAIQEELWIRTGLNFHALKWDREEKIYIIQFVFRDKKIRAKCKVPFNLGYELEELTQTSLSELIEGFYSYLIAEIEIYADQYLEKGFEHAELMILELDKHKKMWEKYCAGEISYKDTKGEPPDMVVTVNNVIRRDYGDVMDGLGGYFQGF